MTTFFSCVRIFWFSLRLRVQIFIMTVIIKCGSQSAIDGGDWVRPISAERAKGLVAVRSVRGQKQDARRSRSPRRLMVIKWPRWLTEYPLKCRPNPCSATKRNLAVGRLKCSDVVGSKPLLWALWELDPNARRPDAMRYNRAQVTIDASKRLIQADGMNLTWLDGGCFKQISKEALMIIRRTHAAC